GHLLRAADQVGEAARARGDRPAPLGYLSGSADDRRVLSRLRGHHMARLVRGRRDAPARSREPSLRGQPAARPTPYPPETRRPTPKAPGPPTSARPPSSRP